MKDELQRLNSVIDRNTAEITKQNVLLGSIKDTINAIKVSVTTSAIQEIHVLPDLPVTSKESLQILNENILSIDGFSKQLVTFLNL